MEIYENLKYNDDFTTCYGFYEKDPKNMRVAKLHKNTRVIDKDAFKKCEELEQIVLNEKLEVIGKHAFAASGLEDITLPKNIKVEKGAFSYMDFLRNVKVYCDIPYTCFFNSCIQNLEIHSNTVGVSAFSKASIEKISFKGIVRSIGADAFLDSYFKEKSVFLPKGMLYVNSNAFTGTHLKSITIPNSVEMCCSYEITKDSDTIFIVDKEFYEKNECYFENKKIEFYDSDVLFDASKTFKDINTIYKGFER